MRAFVALALMPATALPLFAPDGAHRRDAEPLQNATLAPSAALAGNSTGAPIAAVAGNSTGAPIAAGNVTPAPPASDPNATPAPPIPSSGTRWVGPLPGACRDASGRRFDAYSAEANVSDPLRCRALCNTIPTCGSFTFRIQGALPCTVHTDDGIAPEPAPPAGWAAENTTGRALHPVQRNATAHSGEDGADCYCRLCIEGDTAAPSAFPTFSPRPPTHAPSFAPSNTTGAPLVPSVSPSQAPSLSPTAPTNHPTTPPSISPTQTPPGSYEMYAFFAGSCNPPGRTVRSWYLKRHPCNLFSPSNERCWRLRDGDWQFADFFGAPACPEGVVPENMSCTVPLEVRWMRKCTDTAEEARSWLARNVAPGVTGWFVQESFWGDGCAANYSAPGASTLTAIMAERVDACVYYPGLPGSPIGTRSFRVLPCRARTTQAAGEAPEVQDLTYYAASQCSDWQCQRDCTEALGPVQALNGRPHGSIAHCIKRGSGAATLSYSLDYFTDNPGQQPLRPRTSACGLQEDLAPPSPAPRAAPLRLLAAAALAAAAAGA
eukprot:TRINITY_DN473_c0_g1_i1.p1 TRINITY_DN473_c0_g1~~TRINITY_DN473_c0_g1_i1.p1  ORF type:complete len:570 (+),score=122.73 TRINITY_DN473_c0_g1_i1:70-1710(+)